MESNGRYYSRRAAEEASRAARAITPEAQARHRQLASLFATRFAELEAECSSRSSASGR